MKKRMYNIENLNRAIESVLNGEMSQSVAAKAYGVPQTTISFKLAKLKKQPNLKL